MSSAATTTSRATANTSQSTTRWLFKSGQSHINGIEGFWSFAKDWHRHDDPLDLLHRLTAPPTLSHKP